MNKTNFKLRDLQLLLKVYVDYLKYQFWKKTYRGKMVVTTSVLDFDWCAHNSSTKCGHINQTYVYVMIDSEIRRVFNVLEEVIPESWQVHFLYVLCIIL